MDQLLRKRGSEDSILTPPKLHGKSRISAESETSTFAWSGRGSVLPRACFFFIFTRVLLKFACCSVSQPAAGCGLRAAGCGMWSGVISAHARSAGLFPLSRGLRWLVSVECAKCANVCAERGLNHCCRTCEKPGC